LINTELIKTIEKYLGHNGRMIGYSKSVYCQDYPDSIVYFNACIFDDDANQVWWGDIDTTLDKTKLDQIAEWYTGKFYVTRETEYRTDLNIVTKKQLENDKDVIVYN